MNSKSLMTVVTIDNDDNPNFSIVNIASFLQFFCSHEALFHFFFVYFG